MLRGQMHHLFCYSFGGRLLVYLHPIYHSFPFLGTFSTLFQGIYINSNYNVSLST